MRFAFWSNSFSHFLFFQKPASPICWNFRPLYLFEKNSAIFFARPGLQNLKINPSRNSIRACRTRSIPNVPSSPACRCAAGIPRNRNIWTASCVSFRLADRRRQDRHRFKAERFAQEFGFHGLRLRQTSFPLGRCVILRKACKDSVAVGCVGFVVGCYRQSLVSPSIPTRKLPSGE